VGFPLTTVAFGAPGLALAVIYAEFQFLIPVDAVVLGLGRHYAGPGSRAAPAPGLRRLIRSWLLNPPVVAGATAVALRVLGVDISGVVAPMGPALGVAIGLIGFVQLGLATPLKPPVHDRAELWRGMLTIVLRCGMAPLILLAIGRLIGVHIPGVFLLLAAMPVAFNTMVVAAVFDLDAELARLLIAVSTPLVIAGVVAWQLVA
jgi:predicted permease